MAYDLSEELGLVEHWLSSAINNGCLDAHYLTKLNYVRDARAGGLFEADVTGELPILIALVGGTGVGKSSLLNRLAQQTIAKTGVERPTSREVTLYHHRALSLQTLPAGAPQSTVRIAHHDDDTRRQVVWIDMPDFDSVEIANHRLVLDWLPYLDVLIYVVSPERYRDAKTWQLLKSESTSHVWLFVMNQWDRGDPAQFDDFARQLQMAGFSDPFLFRTCCNGVCEDQFAALVAHLQQLGSQQMSQQLQRHHEQQRLNAVLGLLEQCHDQLRSQQYQKLSSQWDDDQESQVALLLQSLQWGIRQTALNWTQNASTGDDSQLLWDNVLQTRLDDGVDRLLFSAADLGVPLTALKPAANFVKQNAGKQLLQQAVQAGRLAMLKPGNSMQRALIGVTRVLEVLLPLTALSVVGYRVFAGYYESAAEHTAYLGTDFAVHSVMLIALSWLIPFFLRKQLQPSMLKAAERGLAQGAEMALRTLFNELRQKIADQKALAEQALLELDGLRLSLRKQQSGKGSDALLSRSIAEHSPVQADAR